MLSISPHVHCGQTNHMPKFLHNFPASKVLPFEVDDGFCVFESNTIAFYKCNEELWGRIPEVAELC